MPGKDRTGPMGMGAMTGRAAGYCAGYGAADEAGPDLGRGFGMGYGRGRGAWGRGCNWGGRGWRNRPCVADLPVRVRYGRYATPYQATDPEQEKQALRIQAEALQSEMDFINKRLGEIETKTRAE